MRTRINYIFVFLIGLFLGYLTTQWKFFEVDTSINLVRLLGIIVNASILVVIASYITGKNNNLRYEKELIINQIDELIILADNLPLIFKDNGTHKVAVLLDVTSAFKQLNMKIQRLKNCETAASINISINTSVISTVLKQWKEDITERTPVSGNYILSGYELNTFIRQIETSTLELHTQKFLVNNH